MFELYSATPDPKATHTYPNTKLQIIQILYKIISVDVIGKLERCEIFPFVGRIEPVNNQNIIGTKLIEPPDDRTADKARTAGHDNFMR